MGPDGSDVAQNVPPGLIVHEDSEPGLRIGSFRLKNIKKEQNQKTNKPKLGLPDPPIFRARSWGDPGSPMIAKFGQPASFATQNWPLRSISHPNRMQNWPLRSQI